MNYTELQTIESNGETFSVMYVEDPFIYDVKIFDHSCGLLSSCIEMSNLYRFDTSEKLCKWAQRVCDKHTKVDLKVKSFINSSCD